MINHTLLKDFETQINFLDFNIFTLMINICMCVCASVCVYLYMYVCMYVCVCVYVCMYVCMYVCIYACMQYVHVYVRMRWCVYVYVLYMYVCVIYVCMYVCMYVCLHVCMFYVHGKGNHQTLPLTKPISFLVYNRNPTPNLLNSHILWSYSNSLQLVHLVSAITFPCRGL